MKNVGLMLSFMVFVNLSVASKDFNILDFGANPNQLSTSAIQKTIDACFGAGGGKVVVPAGRFITGTIFLKSKINLYLEEGAELVSSENLDDFHGDSEQYGMIYCLDAHQVSISGKGVIDGRGIKFYEPDKNHTYPEFDKNLIRQKEGYMPEGEFYTDGPIKRKPKPGMCLVFFHCSDVSITGIEVHDTPSWAIRFAYCDGVLVDGLTIKNNVLIPNSDGVHCTASRNIRIANSNIVAGDDAIIMTGFAKIEDTPGFNSKEQDKYLYGNKTIFAENIQVTNCHLSSSSSGIRIGYGQHPIRNGIFTNIVIYNSNRGIGIFAHDSASIENLIFSDIIIETRLYNGQWWGNGEPIHLSSVSRFEGEPPGKIKNVHFNNIMATGEHGIILFATTENPMESIKFNNVQLLLRKGKETMGYGGNFDLRPAADISKQIFEHDIPGLYAQYVNNLSIIDFTLDWAKDLPVFFTHGIECENVMNLYINNFTGGANPNAPTGKKVALSNTTMVN